MNLEFIYDRILKGDLTLVYQNRLQINQLIEYLLGKDQLSTDEIHQLEMLIKIGNAVYNNLDTDNIPIEDGVYDLLIEKFKRYNNNNYPVGSPPITFQSVNQSFADTKKVAIPLLTPITKEDIDYQNRMIFPELLNSIPFNYKMDYNKPIDPTYIPKQTRNTKHNHPDLVGTFDKCKFVLNSQAEELGVINDKNVAIVERDFFQPLLRRGTLDPNEELTIIAELKYDGISVEGDCTDVVLSARSRGDTGEGVAKDITPLLEGYQFNQNKPFPSPDPIGVKFEAIINKFNLAYLNQISGSNYKNCRTAMIGIQGASNGRSYRDLISLIPIATDIKDISGEPIDRLVEIELLNEYFTRDELFRYSVFTGNYTSILFQMKRYVEEAEYARRYLPFLYDGVVFEFYDPKIRKMLGRDHSIDRYKVAVKFNPLKKQSIFRGYSYTVGQDGSITPMIHYDPVEFMGTIHTKSSGHSYERFKALNLHVGDIIDVTYTNDVMPYVTKPENEFNLHNSMKPNVPEDTFPTMCPCCGAPLEISKSGKSIYCTNIECSDREVNRMTNMLAKLGVKDFSDASVRKLGVRFFHELMTLSLDQLSILGEKNASNLKTQLDVLRKNPIYDFKIIGALGFTDIAIKTWKLIFQQLSLDEFLHYYTQYGGNTSNLRAQLISIKGIGPATIDSILKELPYFWKDIYYIVQCMNIQSSKHLGSKKVIRFTGCRDKQLEEQLSSMGYDIDGNAGVTKNTDYLLVPYASYTQGSKYEKAKKYGVNIIPIEVFENNLDQFL